MTVNFGFLQGCPWNKSATGVLQAPGSRPCATFLMGKGSDL